MPKVNEISVAYSTHGLGADERDVIARLNNHGNVKCSPDLSNERFIVSAKGVGIEYIHKVVDEAIEAAKNLEEKNEAEPLDTLVSFRVNAPFKKIESFVEEIEADIEGVYACNYGNVVTVSSDIFDEKYLIDCVSEYFDIV